MAWIPRDLLPVAPALHYAMGGFRPISKAARRSRALGRLRGGPHRSTRCQPAGFELPTRGPGIRGSRRPSLAETLRTVPRTRSTPAPAVAGTARPMRTARGSARNAALMTANVGLPRSEASLLLAERELERLTGSTPFPPADSQPAPRGLAHHQGSAQASRAVAAEHRRTTTPASLKREAV